MPYYKNRDKLRDERDNGDHSCSKCGAKSNLQIHHKDGNAQNDSGKNVEYLCASCHTSHEWENGKTMPSKKSAEWPGASQYDPSGDILDDYSPDMQRTYPEDSGLPEGEDEIQQLAAALMYGLQQSGSISVDQAKAEIEQMIPMDASADDIINWGVENGLWVSDGMQIRLASLDKEAGGLDWVIDKISSLLIQFMEGLARDAIKKMIPDAEGGIVDQAINALVESGQATEDWEGISLTNNDEGGDDPFFAMGAVKDMSQSDAQDTLDGMGGRHKTCVEQAPDNIDDPAAWCASIVDEAEGTTYWRGKDKKHEGSYINRYYGGIDDFMPRTAASPQLMDDAWYMWINLVTTQEMDRDEATRMVADNYGIDLEELQAYIKENEQFRFAKKTAIYIGDVEYAMEQVAIESGRVEDKTQATATVQEIAAFFVDLSEDEVRESIEESAAKGVTDLVIEGDTVRYGKDPYRTYSKQAETGSEELVDSLDEGQIQDELDERSETEAEDVKREVDGKKLAYDEDSFFDMPSGMNDADMEMQGLEDAGAEYMRGKNAFQPGMPKPDGEGKYFLEGWADAELMYSDYSQSSEDDFRAETIDQFASKKKTAEFKVGDWVGTNRDVGGVSTGEIMEIGTDGDGYTEYTVDMDSGGGIDFFYEDELHIKQTVDNREIPQEPDMWDAMEEDPTFNSHDDPYRDLIS